jgi:hypothetical protein
VKIIRQFYDKSSQNIRGKPEVNTTMVFGYHDKVSVEDFSIETRFWWAEVSEK